MKNIKIYLLLGLLFLLCIIATQLIFINHIINSISMAQDIYGVNNYTDPTGSRNTLEDFSVMQRASFNNEGIISGLVVSQGSPLGSYVQVSAGILSIDCGGSEFLTFRLKTAITDLSVPNLAIGKNYLVVAKIDITNATVTILTVEGTAGTDPNLAEGGSPRVYYLVLARIVASSATQVIDADITQDGATLTNNSTPEIIGRASTLGSQVSQLGEGQMTGKVSYSIVSNDLVISILSQGGGTPSASNPVYVKLDGEVRTITAALTLTLADGTNWFGAGKPVTATREIDLFVSLSYDSTSGLVRLHASRIAGTRRASFSTTNTSTAYIANSGSSNATLIHIVGLVSAKLSAGAGYTWSAGVLPVIQGEIKISRQQVATEILLGGTTAQTISSGTFYYLVKGEEVTINGVNITLSSTGGSGDVTVPMPFEHDGGGIYAPFIWWDASATTLKHQVMQMNSADYVYLLMPTGVTMKVTDIAAGDRFYINFVYLIMAQ